MRYDERGHTYANCKWCKGKGCLMCPSEADKAYKKEFPNGPKPIATFKTDDPLEMATLKSVFGADSINKAFGIDGGGMNELLQKLKDSGHTVYPEGM